MVISAVAYSDDH
ncbi:hypothetical protein VCR3J2_410041 [Vibrio coralliirubri]|uniref:Uncharacterized protein n=1 Tax=Vibrio coralliirubri TaxID=1516159 RepID=A0AA86XA14_9VIBR|nr:hypothetical protein VCR31J2_1270606 [Vibrio coralliirubri]CDU09738.1 hypothetical protein VCR3J2_410041 [Vibrio coralliirubri]